jgi:hypothetical protein
MPPKASARPKEQKVVAPAPAKLPPPPEPPSHCAELTFKFNLERAPPPPPRTPVEDATQQTEDVPTPTVDNTFFVLRVGEADQAQVFELAHPHSGAAATSCTAKFAVTESMVRWLAEQRQGLVTMSLCRRADESAEPQAVFGVPLDIAPLLFGWPRVEASFNSHAQGKTSALPTEAVPLVSAMSVSLSSSLPFLPTDLAQSLNPTAVSVLHADGLPATYSGTPFKAPYVELAERCAPVRVVWRLLGQEGATAPRPHAEEIVWRNERKIFLAGDIGIDEMRRRLREEGISLEVRDRDPQPEPLQPEAEQEGEQGGAVEGDPAAAAVEQKVAQKVSPSAPRHRPFGVARYRLGEMVGRQSTDRATYAPEGIRSAPTRRLTLCLDVQPCERPRTRPEPEEEGVEYFAGTYVQSCCQVTVQVEMVAELPPESEATLGAQATSRLGRIVTLIGYKDTHALKAILDTVEEVNSACGLTSAANWENYKDAGKDDLDMISGVQLVDGPTRLFVLEGHAPAFGEDDRPLNAMARLSLLLERTEPNSKTAFTLMDRRLIFTHRCYNSFELPTKLIKLRMPLPKMLLRPEIYQHLRVSDPTRDAVLALARLCAAPTLRVALKHEAFPAAADLLQLQNMYGAVITIRDREGVPFGMGDTDSTRSSARASTVVSTRQSGVSVGKSSGSHSEHEECRKAPTDARNPLYLQALRERAERPPADYIRINKESLPAPVPRAPLPEWYLESIEAVRAQMGGKIVGTYSGQRLNPTEMQKAYLQKRLLEMGNQPGLGAHGRGVHYTYAADYLNAESMGEAEVRPPPPPKQKPWDKSHREAYMPRDGRRSQFEMLQPSATRLRDLDEPWGLDLHEADAEARERHRQRETSAKARFDALPSNQRYLEVGYPGPSVFQQPEEQANAERREMKQGAMETWSSKVAVDDPVLRVSLKHRDKVTQQEKLHGLLLDAPQKKALQKLYRGKYRLESGKHIPGEPSIFMHESTVEGIETFENSLRERLPERWSSTRLANSMGNVSLASTTAPRAQSHALIRSLDFIAGPVREADKRAMGIPVTKETKRFHPPLGEQDRRHTSFSRDAFVLQMSR